MKKITLYLLVLLTFCNCQNKKENQNLNAEEIKDINEVVEAVIIQDSLDVFSKNEDSTMFCNELRKLNISIPEKTKDGFTPPPPPRSIYITTLLSEKIIGERFSTTDSLNLLKQNSNPERIKIESNLLDKLNVITVEKAYPKRKKSDKLFTFYEMTIPIFSLDRQKAYIELDHNCPGLCGSGKAIYLKKVNGKWHITEKWRTWIS